MTEHDGPAVLGQLDFIGVLVIWVVTVLRAPAVVRQPQQRPLWLAVGLAGIAMTLQIKWISDGVVQIIDSPHRTTLIKEFVGLFAATAVVDFIVKIVDLRRITFIAYPSAFLIAGVLLCLDVTSPAHGTHVIPNDPSRAATPCTAYWLILLSYHLTVCISCAVVCWRFARRAERGPLRSGLRLFGVGISLAGLLMTLSLVDLFTRLAWIPELYPSVSGMEAIFMAAGTGVPLAQSAARAMFNFKATYLLYPMWYDLVQETPSVTLAPARGRIADLFSSAYDDSHLHIYRRNIEVRDALLLLSSFLSKEDVAQARAHAESNAVPLDLLYAATSACCIRLAIYKSSRQETQGQPWLDLSKIGGGSVHSDICFLLDVVKFYRSPLAEEFMESFYFSPGRAEMEPPAR